MLRGALHIHSTFSDGEFTVPELRAVLMAEGCQFACITDHATYFADDDRLGEYVAACAAHSDASFVFVPGLEFSCVNRLHIAGYGCTDNTADDDPAAVIRHIRASGGIAVIAHPPDALFDWIANLDEVPQGLEVWNSKYDGRYAPRAATFGLLRRLQTRRPDCLAFYGLDLHWRTQYRGLMTDVAADTLEPRAILGALAAGAFNGVKDDVRLPSDGAVDADWLARSQRAHALSDRGRALLKGMKRLLDRTGIPVPAALKAQARRTL